MVFQKLQDVRTDREDYLKTLHRKETRLVGAFIVGLVAVVLLLIVGVIVTVVLQRSG
jgi:hypothetical protein